MSPDLEKALEFIGRLITNHEGVMLKGEIPGTTPDMQAANYRAAVMRRRDLLRIKANMEEIAKGGEPDENELEEMPEERPKFRGQTKPASGFMT